MTFGSSKYFLLQVFHTEPIKKSVIYIYKTISNLNLPLELLYSDLNPKKSFELKLITKIVLDSSEDIETEVGYFTLSNSYFTIFFKETHGDMYFTKIVNLLPPNYNKKHTILIKDKNTN